MNMMKTTCVFLSVFALCIALMATRGSSAQSQDQEVCEPAQSPGVSRSSSGKDAVIGHLETRNRRITILHGPEGSTFTVKTPEGKTLASKLRACQ